MTARELKALHGWIADFGKAGLIHRLEDSSGQLETIGAEYDEEAVTDLLLFEARVAKDLSGKYIPNFADCMEKAKTGEYFTLKGGSKLTPAQLHDFLGQNPGVVVWSKSEQKWTSKVA
jgi:hypothetical protein